MLVLVFLFFAATMRGGECDDAVVCVLGVTVFPMECDLAGNMKMGIVFVGEEISGNRVVAASVP